MNDLHTAELTAELAARTGASAVVNAEHDRNDVDLNRIGDAHERAPAFLRRSPTWCAVVADHGRATLRAARLERRPARRRLGLGCAAATIRSPSGARRGHARFAAGALPLRRGVRRAHQRDRRARYPARNRRTWSSSSRPGIATTHARSSARSSTSRPTSTPSARTRHAPAGRADGAPFLAACDDALPALLAPPDAPRRPRIGARGRRGHAPARVHERVLRPRGCRPRARRTAPRLPAGRRAPPLHRRAHRARAAVTGALAVRATSDGGVAVPSAVRCCTPDTTPFLDLEAGLARARLTDAGSRSTSSLCTRARAEPTSAPSRARSSSTARDTRSRRRGSRKTARGPISGRASRRAASPRDARRVHARPRRRRASSLVARRRPVAIAGAGSRSATAATRSTASS
jgi:hypothetical protein